MKKGLIQLLTALVVALLWTNGLEEVVMILVVLFLMDIDEKLT